MAAGASGVLGGGWTEPKFESLVHASLGRVRLSLTGGPGARVAAAKLRTYSV